MAKKLLWIDMEMSGLDETTNVILEVAAIITDMSLSSLDELHRVVRQPQEILDNMDDWCRKTHGESGLTAAVPNGTPLDLVEKELLDLLDRHFTRADRIVIAGNSIGQDRRFIDKYMKDLSSRLHYRMVDVSSFKEIFREKYGIKFEKKNSHRALDDIHESIRELQGYLSYVQFNMHR